MAAYLIQLKGKNVFGECVNIGVTTDALKIESIIKDVESKYNIEFELDVIQKFEYNLTYPCKDLKRDIHLTVTKIDLL